MKKKVLLSILAGCMIWGLIPNTLVVSAAEDSKIAIKEDWVNAKSSPDYAPELAFDGDKNTYYQTPKDNSEEDYFRYLDVELDGLYEISAIKIFNNTDSYNHYQIYASEDGERYDKVAFKEDDSIPTLKEGTVHTFNTPVKAENVRINLSYNSKGVSGNLAEVEIYGTKIGERTVVEDKIEIQNFDETEWKTKFDKFENDKDYAKAITEQEMTAMVGRVLGEEWQDDFIFELKDFGGVDKYEIDNAGSGKIIVRGNNGVSLASGWNYYLRYYCNVDYNPLFVSNLDMPETLLVLDKKIVKETQYDVRYALNFCTYSYTMAFWGWDEYEAFLDWAAMSGINVMLDIVGQEEIIRRMLNEFDYSDEEVKEYITGPAHVAWYYMQNMTGLGGPLPNEWFEQRVELGRQIHDRMQVFGIEPAMLGYSGGIPNDFKEKNPDATIISQGNWTGGKRPDMLRTYVNEGQRDYFDEMADAFYKAQKEVFGDVADYYAVDPFHEGGKMGDMEPGKVYGTIQSKLLEHNNDATWIIQQWQGSINSTKLNGLVDKNKVLILDLQTDKAGNEQYSVMEKEQVPWVWNMLHSFGGRSGLEANVPRLTQNIPETYENTNYMVGIGITPEGIERCPMVYELIWDMAWTKDPVNYMEWGKKYMERRYGGVNDELMEAWAIMVDTIYGNNGGEFETFINARPAEKITAAHSGGNATPRYDVEELEKVLEIYLNNYDEFKDSECYRFDLADITRQIVGNSARYYHQIMIDAYNDKDLMLFDKYSQHFLALVQLQDDVMNTTDYFQLGRWLNESRTVLDNADDWTKDLFEFNARMLVSTWGSKRYAESGALHDYSNRQMAGMTDTYYLGRWRVFVENYHNALVNGTTPVKVNWFNMEWEWANQKLDEGDSYYFPTESSTEDKIFELATLANNEFTIAYVDEFATSQSDSKYGNLLLGLKAEVNQKLSDEEIRNLTDGDKATGWIGETTEWPAIFTFDLGGSKKIDEIGFTMKEMVVNGVKVTYLIEGFDGKEWLTIAKDTTGDVAGDILLEHQGNYEKLRFTVNSSEENIVPEFMEFIANGTIEDEKKPLENIALGLEAEIKYTLNGKEEVRKTKNLTDGDLSTQDTISTGISGDYTFVPAEFSITLPEARYIDSFATTFEKEGIRYQFTMEVEDEEGNRTVVLDKSDNTSDLEKVYTAQVHQEVKKVIVNLKERASGGNVSAARARIHEIEVFAPEVEKEEQIPSEMISSGLEAEIKYTLNGKEEVRKTKNLTDGDLSTQDTISTGISGDYTFVPAEFSITLPEARYIDSFATTFEKEGIRYQFTMEVEDEEGNRTVVLDKSDNTSDLEKVYTAQVHQEVKKVIVNLKERASGGNVSAARARIHEIEVFAPPVDVARQAKIMVNGNEVSTLNDANEATGENLKVKDQIVVQFENPKDISILEILQSLDKVEDGSAYKISYKNEKGNWIVVNDKKSTVKNIVDVFANSILTNEVLIEITSDEAEFKEIRLYKTNFTNDLLGRISEIANKAENFELGEYAGNYSKEIYDELMNKIAEIKALNVTNLNSKEIEELIEEVEEVYMKLRMSYVSIHRTDLLVSLTDAQALMKSSYADKLDIKDAYDKAKQVYDTYKVTQKEIDSVTAELDEKIEKAMEKLPLLEQLDAELVLANNVIEQAVIGDKNGNYATETVETFKNFVKGVEEQKDSVKDNAEISKLIQTLKEAREVFNNSYVVVDLNPLLDALAKVETLEEKDYTKDSWKVMWDAYEKAINVNHDNLGISDVKTLSDALNKGISDLVSLDRDILNSIILKVETLNAENYTSTSWEKLQLVLEEAKTLFNQTSLNQDEVDTMTKKLSDTMDELEKRVDKEGLSEAIDEANALDLDLYTKESVEVLLEALKYAGEVNANEKAAQEEVDNALAKLTVALDDLQPVESTDSEDPDKPTIPEEDNKPGEDGNKGEGTETGDTTNVGGLLALLGVTGITIAYTTRKKRMK